MKEMEENVRVHFDDPQESVVINTDNSDVKRSNFLKSTVLSLEGEKIYNLIYWFK
jgi:hypothetical protein